MKSRVFPLILAILFLLPMVPAVRAEEQAPADPYAAVEKQLRAYAHSLDQSDAVSTASSTLAIHGITMGGRKLNLGESSALTAVVLNSTRFQVAVRDGIVAASEYMRTFGLDTLPFLTVGINWAEGGEYHSIAYLTGDRTYDNRDAKILDSVFSVEGRNDYDDALEWMVGAAYVDLCVTQKEITENEVTYAIVCTITDRFDFHTSLSEGFKQWMSGIGEFLFREFDWEIRLSFELTVPYSCDHTFVSYHWTYDAEHFLMNSDASGGFAENKTEQKQYTPAGGTVSYYHRLQTPVRLLHNKPWVMEYEVRRPGSFVFAPFLDSSASRHPYLYNRSRLYLLAEKYEFVVMSDEEVKELGLKDATARRIHDYGTAMSDLFTYSYKKNYTIRLENKILPGGGNMVYVTVYDENRDVVLNVPMDDYYLTESWGEKMVPQSTDSNGISGLDFIINFIGNRTYRFSADYFDLRVWENGEGSMTESAFSGETVEPTCTEDGGVVHTCALCGYSYQTDTVPAYGHSFGDWYVAKDAVCAENGQERRDCSNCGDFETREIPAPGHDYTPTITAPTCTEQGYTTYVCGCGYRYADDFTEALGHDFTEWTAVEGSPCTESFTEERWCQRCAYQERRTSDPLGHDYESVVVEPSCTVGGYTVHTCTRCGSSYRTDITSPKGHSCEPEMTPATCTEGGYTSYICACGYSYRSNYTLPLGHELGEWTIVTPPTCTEDGSEARFCSRCDHSESRSIDATGHSHVAVVTAPTCTEQGFTTHTCPCGDSYVTNYTDALGHEYVEGICARCGAEDPDYGKPVENPFTDVPAGEWYEVSVLWAVEQGITDGTSDTTFSPDDPCQRAQVVTLLWRAAGSPAPESLVNPFVDVTPGDYYYSAVLWAVENGITDGTDDTHFDPKGICTRSQVVTFLHRAFGDPPVENISNPFTDVPDRIWYSVPVLWAVEKGITDGTTNTTFSPDAPCTRAQVVTFLYRAYNG